MEQFPIYWTLRTVNVDNINQQKSVCLKLDNEWTMVCFMNDRKNECFKPQFVEIRRVSTIDEVSISGSLYLKGYPEGTPFHAFPPLLKPSLISPETIPVHEFSRLMKSGSPTTVINFSDATSGSSRINYYLQGVVNITSVNALGNEGCRTSVNTKHMEELSNNLGLLLDPETSSFSDVVLKCGDASISAHKNILSVRSPVFAAKFQRQMRKSLENEVVIDDVDASVLRMMLAYVYKGKLHDLTVTSASDLLLAAHKYQIEDLTRGCSDFLKDNLSSENVLRILCLGDLYCIDLKTCAINYICNSCKFSVLEKTEEWKTMRPDLAIDVLALVVKGREKLMETGQFKCF